MKKISSVHTIVKWLTITILSECVLVVYSFQTTLNPLLRKAQIVRYSNHYNSFYPNNSNNMLYCPITRLYNNNNSNMNDDNNDNKNPKRFSRKILKFKNLNPMTTLQQIPTKVQKARTTFQSLSRKGKVIAILQYSALALALGSTTYKIQKVRTTAAATSSRTMKASFQKPIEVPYSVFMDLVEQSSDKGHVVPGKYPPIKLDRLLIGKSKIGFRIHQLSDDKNNNNNNNNNDVSSTAVISQPKSFYTNKVEASPELIQFLRQNSIPFSAVSTKTTNTLAALARSSILIIYMLFLLRMYRAMSGRGGGGAGDTPGKLARFKRGSSSSSMDEDNRIVRFEDIEGIDGAKFEVMELVDALSNPGKYEVLGARAPKGLLLEGPPGTGKTMLARACAASAGVPLLYCSGSDFVEMFVGRGAARVRKTFERASKLSPCIIFIDELDALGKSRVNSELFGGGMNMRSNDEAEQTLNQLLACMDGLDSKKGICVLAATNRREVLDTALIRPGRFDRIIKVNLPDASGRERILRVHAKKLPGFTEGNGIDEKRMGSLGKGNAVDLSAVAAVTGGLSGAELEFIVNEAAIRAVRRVSSAIREGQDPNKINASVKATDFEESVRNYFETRKPNGSVRMSDVFNNVMRPKIS